MIMAERAGISAEIIIPSLSTHHVITALNINYHTVASTDYASAKQQCYCIYFYSLNCLQHSSIQFSNTPALSDLDRIITEILITYI